MDVAQPAVGVHAQAHLDLALPALAFRERRVAEVGAERVAHAARKLLCKRVVRLGGVIGLGAGAARGASRAGGIAGMARDGGGVSVLRWAAGGGDTLFCASVAGGASSKLSIIGAVICVCTRGGVTARKTSGNSATCGTAENT